MLEQDPKARELVDAHLLPCTLWDDKDCLIGANDLALRSMSALNFDEVGGLSFRDFLPPLMRPLAAVLLAARREVWKRGHYAFRFDQGERPLLLTFWRVDWGGSSATLATWRDANVDPIAPWTEMLESVKGLHFCCDETFTTLTYVSTSVRELLGYSRRQLMSQPELWSLLLHSDDRPLLAEALERLGRTSQFELRCRMYRSDGDLVWLEFRGNVKGAAPVGIHGIAFDVSREVALEEQLARHRETLILLHQLHHRYISSGRYREVFQDILDSLIHLVHAEEGYLTEAGGECDGMELELLLAASPGHVAVDESYQVFPLLAAAAAKAAFLASMSHELRTPLNGIVGMASLLGMQLEGPEQREQVETIKDCAHNLVALVTDILDFSSLEAGRLRFEESDADWDLICEQALHTVRPLALAKRLELSALREPEVPAFQRMDGRRMRQVVTNLVSNAVKFTDAGWVHVYQWECRPGFGRLEVRDSGIGIAWEDQRKLFEQFSQLDNSSTRRYDGTGLGLAISKQLVESMGGSIGVSSEPGQGSTFWIEYPYRPVSAQRESPLRGLRVALVMAAGRPQRYLRQQLAELGAEVVEFLCPRADFVFSEGEPERPNWIRVSRQAGAAAGDSALVLPLRRSWLVDRLTQPASPVALTSEQPRRVLLVEDNSINVKVMTRLLHALGHQVEVARDGYSALQADVAEIELVLMDLNMPDMDGLEATRRLRSRGFERPVIAVTAQALEGTREECLAAGMSDYLVKPVSLESLQAMLERWSGRSADAPALDS